MVLSFHTARRYRGGHSRVYLPVGDNTKLQDDLNWLSAFCTTIQDAWTSIQSDVYTAIWGTGGTFTQVMASRYDGFTNESYGSPLKYRRVATPRAAGVLYPILNYTAQQPIGTQRRRVRPA